MTAWILTLGLQNLRAQVDAAFPGRDKTSDGTVGDKIHQAEVSGHNPDDTPGSRPEWNGDPDNIPEVRAWDMDNDLAPGIDCQLLVDHIRALPNVSSVLRYIIYDRLIYEAANSWKPRAYTGPSPHLEHVHFSGAYSQSADNDTSFDYRLEEIPVALTAADKTWIQQQIDQAATAAAQRVWATQFQRPGEAKGKTTSAGAYQSYTDVVTNTAADHVIATLGPKVDALAARLPNGQ